MSLDGSKGGGRSTSSTMPDQQTQEWVKRIFDASKGAAGSSPVGANPLTTGAGDFYAKLQQLSQGGLAALSGDANATRALSSPHTQQVIDANRGDWAAINRATENQVNSGATLAGAFGGSRAAVAAGAALGANNRAQATQEAQLRESGYADAMRRASELAGLGVTGAQGAAGVGDTLRQNAIESNPYVWQMQMLRNGLSGLPTGSRTVQKGKQWSVGAKAEVLPSLI